MRLPDLGRRGEGWVWIQVVLMAAVPLVGGLAAPWPRDVRVPMVALGTSLVLAGCTLLVLGMVGLGQSFAVPPGPGARARLVTTGIYARARHPIFGSWILLAWGFAVALSPWALPIAALLWVELTGKAAVEERFLENRYPGYGAYRSRVPRRFLPRMVGSRPQGPGDDRISSGIEPRPERASSADESSRRD